MNSLKKIYSLTLWTAFGIVLVLPINTAMAQETSTAALTTYEYLQIITNGTPIAYKDAKDGNITSENPNIEILYPNGKTDQEYENNIASIITQFSDDGWELIDITQAVLPFGSKNVVQMRYFFKREKKIRRRR